jgi:hypothetical protein
MSEAVQDNVIIRSLDSSDPKDHEHFSILLDDYANSSTKNENGTYPTEKISFFVTWLKEQFKTHAKKDFMVSAKFVNNELVNIIVGCKLEVKWGRSPKNISDAIPYWYMTLAYFKNKSWNSPQTAVAELTDGLVRNFEIQGYYKMYMIKKAPFVLKKLPEGNSYTTMKNWEKITPGLDRYNTTIEKIFYTQEDIDDFKKFSALSSILPPIIKKPIMLVAMTLDPNIPFKV